MSGTDRGSIVVVYPGWKYAALVLVVVVTGACGADASITTTRPELYRGQYHFSPLQGWMNDPNGLVYLDGEYHLFFQNNPNFAFFGEIHWGHAVSTDLIHWDQLAPAIAPDPELGLAFSGSAVIGHGAARAAVCGDGDMMPCLIAALTHHGGTDGTEKQSLAFSTDRGRSFTMYAGNPVLANQGVDDFRDPKVLWHQPTNQWVMVLAVHDDVELYGSTDLVAWSLLSRFTPTGAGDGELECPELFELPVENAAGATRWVLKFDRNRGFRDAQPASEYMLGDFDGTTFVPDDQETRLVDHGSDFYAAQQWSNAPDNRATWIAWMNNWTYALALPTDGWRGAMTVPRDVSLVQLDQRIQLRQRPIPELGALRDDELTSESAITVDGTHTLSATGAQLEVRLRVAPGSAQRAGIRVRVGDGEATDVGYDAGTQSVYVDRTRGGNSDVSDALAVRFDAPAALRDGAVDLIIYVDSSSVEVFADDGLAVITARVFPRADSNGLELFSEGAPATFEALQVHRLRSIWSEPTAAVRAPRGQRP